MSGERIRNERHSSLALVCIYSAGMHIEIDVAPIKRISILIFVS